MRSLDLPIVPSEHLPVYGMARNALCFAIAFFPRVFITAMRQRTRKALGVDSTLQETVSGLKAPVLQEALTNLANDARIRVLRRLWQAGAALD